MDSWTLVRGPLALLAALTFVGCAGTAEPPDPPAGDPCEYHDDCGTGRVCFDQVCHATATCNERRNCRNVPVCKDDQCFCDEDTNLCRPWCETDNDCPSDGHCLDGICERYPFNFADYPPPEVGARGQLRVGLARVPLEYPMGVSMAGYGSRIGPRTPYQDSLGGSHSWFDRPDVRAAVFDDGKELFVLLRIPTSWTTDFMLARTAAKVAERTGINVLDKIVSTAPHSHSQPARYWHLVVGLGFGFFGYGEFSGEVFERITDSFADAVELALMNRQPAQFGYAVLDDFDPENRIHRDRRPENNNLPGYMRKDDRMVVMRVDDMQGEPIAVFSNFGIHGTVFGHTNPVITADAGGGVEVELNRLASEKYGRPVMAFFLQGNAGDISPAGDDLQHNDFERLQVIGRRAWATVEPALDAIQTSPDVQVGLQTGRLTMSHEELGYSGTEFFDSDVSCEATPQYFRFGAFQCVEGSFSDDDPATAFTDGDLNCVFSVECLTGGHPIPQFQKTVLSVVRLGSLALLTMPGEPLSQFGRDSADRVKEAIDGVTDAAVLGYSQDHHFYLLNEDDWLQGGYEPSRDIWGWKLGPFLTENSARLASELSKEPEDRVFDARNIKPMYWPLTAEELARVELTASTNPTEIRDDVPAQVEVMTEISLAWEGGHPGTDLPHVTLLVQDGDAFVPYLHPSGLPYDDRGFEMIVTYEGDCNRSQCNDHQWRARWQDGRDFPPGTYKLQAEGHAWDGSSRDAYTVQSQAFELVPSSRLQIDEVAIAGGQISGFVLDPPQVEFTDAEDGQTAKGNAFYLRSIEVPAHLGAPIAAGTALTASGSLTPSGGVATPIAGVAQVSVSNAARKQLVGRDLDGNPRYQGERERPTSRFTLDVAGLGALPAGDYFVQLELTDPLGHHGTFTATITK